MKSLPEHAGPHGSMKLTLLRAAQRLLVSSVALCAALMSTAPALAQAALPAPLREALVSAGISPGAVGLYVQEVGAAQPLLEHNADRSMNPASVMKLLTTLAGLELLGPNYTWRTEAWLDGTLSGEVLQGNLVLKGYG